MHHLNIVDVEATCWEGEPPAGQASEIIEIGVCVVDTSRWERVARHRILVRPTRSRVSPFCTDLTGLAQSDVDNGLTFADACEQLRRSSGCASGSGWRKPWRTSIFRSRDGITAAMTTLGTSAPSPSSLPDTPA